MLGLGTPIQLSAQSAVESERAGTAWTETSHSGGTTPNIRLSGTPTTTVITLFIDDTNDWSGDVADYSLTSVEVNNVTDGNSSTGNTFNFSSQHGVGSDGERELRTAHIDTASLVRGGRGDTVTITGNLTRAGYASPEMTGSLTY